MNRRNFFKKSSFLGAVMLAAVATAAVMVVPPRKEDNSDLEPTGISCLTLHDCNKVEEPEINGSSLSKFSFINNPTPTNTTHLAVGKDNRLWGKVDGVWKRVMLENV